MTRGTDVRRTGVLDQRISRAFVPELFDDKDEKNCKTELRLRNNPKERIFKNINETTRTLENRETHLRVRPANGSACTIILQGNNCQTRLS